MGRLKFLCALAAFGIWVGLLATLAIVSGREPRSSARLPAPAAAVAPQP